MVCDNERTFTATQLCTVHNSGVKSNVDSDYHYPNMPFPITTVFQEWRPFRIDALGLVTIMGASGADRDLGQLSVNRFTDWLPMLGAYVVANDQITEPIPSFSLYNIIDSIVATDLAGWFSRWLLSQNFTMYSSTVTISIAPQSTKTKRRSATICAAAFGAMGAIAFVVLPGLIGDWWGLTNRIAMLVSVMVRQVVLGQIRSAQDHSMEMVQKETDSPVKLF